MKRYGLELEFISRIDGSGRSMKLCFKRPDEDNTIFRLRCLSLTNRTFIASEMSTYVVKLKNHPNAKR